MGEKMHTEFWWGNPEKKRSHRKRKRKWKYFIKTEGTGWPDVNWNDVVRVGTGGGVW
jgi:hypothetical protein